MQTPDKSSNPKKNSVTKKNEAPQYLYAYRFQALQDYFSGSLTDKGVLLLEYLIMVGAHWLRKNQLEFFHSKNTIKKRTGISQNTASNLIKKFEEYGFMVTDVVNDGTKNITHFELNFARIAGRLGILFGDEDVKRTPAQLERIEQRHEALRHLARLQLDLKQRKKKLLAK